MTTPREQTTEMAKDTHGRSRAAARRRARRAEIVARTRELFDARGMRSANIDDVARAVGVNRAIIYRHVASKEELFALTLADYLVELDGILQKADDTTRSPRERLAAVATEFGAYCLRFPAFVDCALALLGRPGEILLDEISDSSLLKLGTLMSGELRRIADIVVQGRGGGDDVDADLLANAMYLQALGIMHLARSGFVVKAVDGGGIGLTQVDSDQILALLTRMTLDVAFPAASGGDGSSGR
jgi:AcrR family transcriptional regulator